MLGRLSFIVLLGLTGCRESATLDQRGPAPAAVERTTAEQPEAKQPEEAAHDQPLAPASEPASEAVSETEGDPQPAAAEPPPPNDKRKIIRVRCKPGYTPCNYGRKCCNLLEVCGKDQRCHPLE